MKKKQTAPDVAEKTITYSLNKLIIRKFSIIEPLEDLTADFDRDKFKIGFNLSLSSDPEKSSFQIVLGIFYNYELSGNDMNLLELSLISDFHISNIGTVLEIKGNSFIIPDELLYNLTSVAYSSARGIIFSKTQGSYLNSFILPLMDPKVLVGQTLASQLEHITKKEK